MNRRTFFATTAGALTASVIPVKSENTENVQQLLTLEEGDTRYYKEWEYWDGVTWVPRGEERCTIDNPSHKHIRHHWHPGGNEN